MDAYKYGLIRLSGLRRIAKESFEDFDSIASEAWASVTGGLSARESRRQELRAAVVRANTVLKQEGASPVPLPPLPPLYPRGTPVRTAFGGGVVDRFRQSDGMYEVLLQWDGTGTSAPVKSYLTQASLSSVVRPLHPQAPVSVANPVSLKGARPEKPGSLVGAKCWTEYGLCKLVRLRPELRDRGRAEVLFDWGGKGFLRFDSVVVLACSPTKPIKQKTPPGSPPLFSPPPPIHRLPSLRSNSVPPPLVPVGRDN